MSHLAILEYQWEQSFLDWPPVPIRMFWHATRHWSHRLDKPMESLIPPKPSPSPHRVPVAASSLCTRLALTRVIYVPWGNDIWWSMSLHVIALVKLSLWWVSKELRTSAPPCQTRQKTASHSQKEEERGELGEIREGWQKEERGGCIKRNWHEDKIS